MQTTFLQRTIAPLKRWFAQGRCGAFKKNKSLSFDQIVDINHMKNTGGTPKDKWKRVGNILIDPMVVIPVAIGIASAFCALYFDKNSNEVLKIISMLISTIGIGVGINYFSFFYRQEIEKRTLKFKAETTVRTLNTTIKSILRKERKDKTDYDTIDKLVDTIDYWKDYYPTADSTILQELMALKALPNSSTDTNSKVVEMEHNFAIGPTSSYIQLSGDTGYNVFKKENK